MIIRLKIFVRFKSPLGFRLFRDGHIVALKYCPVERKKLLLFQVSERAKTEDGHTFKFR